MQERAKRTFYLLRPPHLPALFRIKNNNANLCDVHTESAPAATLYLASSWQNNQAAKARVVALLAEIKCSNACFPDQDGLID